MIHVYGNTVCPKCTLQTKVMCEHLKSEEDSVCLIGNELKQEEEIQKTSEDGVCEYCQYHFKLYVIVKENRLSAILNENEEQSYRNGEFNIHPAKEGEGLEEEKRKNLKQFHQTFTTPFHKHPFHTGREIKVEGKKWKIKSVYKKENTERDIEKRMLFMVPDEYWYQVENGNEKRWITVLDTEEEGNAILMMEAPSIREHEEVHDVTETLYKNTFLFEKPISEWYTVKAYQYLSGVRIYLFNKEDGDEVLEMDVFGNDIEDAMEQIEGEFATGDQ